VALSLNNLAVLYKFQRRVGEAESLLQQALAMNQRLFKGDHPDVALSLNNLAVLYKFQRRVGEAESLLQQARAMFQRLFADDHPDVAQILNNLAGCFAATHRYDQALDYMKQAMAIENRLIHQAFAYSCESDRLTFLQQIRHNFDIFLSLIYQHFPNSPRAIQTALDLILQRKSLTAAVSAALNQAIHSGRYPHLQSEFTKLRQLSDQIIHYIYHEPRPDLIPQLQREQNQLQKQLTAQVPEIQLQDQQIDCHTVAFAGANRWLEGKPLPETAEKGMVFAQDIAALDLWETELAILSACQTGIGDVKLGEGVFGLRRAFAIAGTKTLIMSLWSVPDRATALLMNRFLSNLRQGIGRRVALKEAQDYIRTITVKQLQESELGCSILAELEKALPQTRQLHPTDQPLAHPYFWGAWVCQGETKAVKLNRL
jgi:tetratricopeptide (TPR) repeat protein